MANVTPKDIESWHQVPVVSSAKEPIIVPGLYVLSGHLGIKLSVGWGSTFISERGSTAYENAPQFKISVTHPDGTVQLDGLRQPREFDLELRHPSSAKGREGSIERVIENFFLEQHKNGGFDGRLGVNARMRYGSLVWVVNYVASPVIEAVISNHVVVAYSLPVNPSP